MYSIVSMILGLLLSGNPVSQTPTNQIRPSVTASPNVQTAEAQDSYLRS
jgi:hypothetical protein